MLFDVSGLDDGVAFLTVFDPVGTLTEAQGPFRIEDGRVGGGTGRDRGLESNEEAQVLWMEADEAMAHEAGAVRYESLHILGSGSPLAPKQEGAELVLQSVLPPSARLYGAGPAEVVERSDPERVAQLRLQRRVDTEPCPPPIGRFEHFGGPDDPNQLSNLSREERILSVLEVPDGVVAVSNSWLVLARRGEVAPTHDPQAEAPRRTIRVGQLGASSLEAVVGLDDATFLVLGNQGGDGRGWVFQSSPAGLTELQRFTLPFSVVEGARAPDDTTLYVVDASGVVHQAPGVDGPWTSISEAGTWSRSNQRLAVGPLGRVARSSAGVVDVLGGPGWTAPSRVVTPSHPDDPREVYTALQWVGDAVWAGRNDGQLFVATSSSGHFVARPQPPRLVRCARDPQPVDGLWLEESIRGLEVVDGHALVLFRQCSAVWSLRQPDQCAGVGPWVDDAPARLHDALVELHVGQRAVYMAGNRGLLLAAERR